MPEPEALPITADAIFDSVRGALLVLSADLHVRRANRAFYRTFDVAPGETEGKLVYALGNGQWDIPDLRRLLEDVLPHSTSFDDFEVAHDFPSVGRKVMLLNVRRILHDGNATETILLAIEDVTDQRRSEDRQALLLKLSDALRPLADPAEILAAAAALLGKHLRASRAGYAEDLGDGERVAVTCNYTAGVPPIEGVYRYDDYGARLTGEMRAGRTVAQPDIAADASLSEDERQAHASLQLAATVNVPLVKDGRLQSILFVHQAVPRRWSPAEVRLAEETAERTWAAVERARAEADLRANRAQLSAAFEALPLAVGFAGPDGRLALANGEMQRYLPTGLVPSRDEARWHRWQAWHPDGRRVARSDFPAACALRGEAVVPGLEMLFTQNDGTEMWTVVAATPVRGGGTVTGAALVVADVDGRKRAEEALRSSEERFRTLFDSMDQGFCVIEVAFDPAGGPADFKFVELNPAFQRQSGLKGVLGRSAREAVPGLEAFWYDTYARVAATGEPTRFFHQAVALDRWFEVYAFRLQGAAPNRVAILFTDITDRTRATDALKEADRRKDEFLATLAHELRNPLAPIRNGLEVMKLAIGDSQSIERSRSMMERQVEQMTHLVDDLMDLSRVSRGKIVLQKTRLRIATPVRTAVESSRPLIDRQGHALVVDVPDEPTYVDGDNTRLTQVFSNLLNNAAKYTDRGGRIRLSVGREGREVVVRVEDSGVGIPSDMLPKVFDMFAQVDRSLEKAQGGLGIGLNIVRRLVEMHGGTIAAESDGHGKGSAFTVRLPAVQGKTADRNDTVIEGGTRPAARQRILVADDNRDGAVSLAEMLELMGNEARTAHDGMEAIAVAEAFHPDVILMDIGMPVLNGYDACRRIRLQPWGKDIVIVAQTGWGQDEDVRNSKEAGFDHHLIKPVDPGSLQKLLAGLKRP